MCNQSKKKEERLRRLERVERAVKLLERMRAFYRSQEKKVDFARLSRLEMGYLMRAYRGSRFFEEKLREDEKEVLDELFEKAVGIRDTITWTIVFSSGYDIYRCVSPEPWKSSLSRGRHLDRLIAASKGRPDFKHEAAIALFKPDAEFVRLR